MKIDFIGLGRGAGAGAVVTMLPAGAHVRMVYEGAVLDAVDPAAILIDCSTIDLATAQDIATQAVARGLEMVDAPSRAGSRRSKRGR